MSYEPAKNPLSVRVVTSQHAVSRVDPIFACPDLRPETRISSEPFHLGLQPEDGT